MLPKAQICPGYDDSDKERMLSRQFTAMRRGNVVADNNHEKKPRLCCRRQQSRIQFAVLLPATTVTQ